MPPIGRVQSLHRYPVKSMAGEDLDGAELTGRGLHGDRAFAVVDRETGRVVSAKRPRRWPGILAYRARLLRGAGGAAEEVGTAITLPDGRTGDSTDRPALEELLSESLGRRVTLAAQPEAGARLEYQWPDQPGLWYQGRLYRDELTEHALLPGTFFDSGMVHLVTTASLRALRARAPESGFEAARFRANLVVDTGGTAGFLENAWVGRTVRIGDRTTIRITKPCIRCVMVNLAHRDADADSAVLAAAFAHNQGNVGVKGDVLTGGWLRVGDPVVVE